MNGTAYKSNHLSILMDKLNRERKTTGKYCDITICAGSHDFKAHKSVLSAFSDFYDKMFSTEMREKYEKKANIHDVDKQTMEIILDFIYTGDVMITDDNVYKIIAASDYMEVPYLQKYCLEFMLDKIDANNCLSIRAYAKRYNFEAVVAKADEVLREEFEVILGTDSFKELSISDVSELLELKDKQVASEANVYNAVIGWVKHDLTKRGQHFEKLFKMIKLENMSRDFLQNVVAEEALVMGSLECTKLIIKSLLPRVANHGIQSAVTRNNMNDDNYTGFLAVQGQKAYCYDVTTKRFHKVQNMKFDHRGGSAVNCNGEVFIISGCNTDSAEKINSKDLSSGWVEVASTNKERWLAASVACNGSIYTVGGLSSTSSGERYDYHDDRWSNIRDMNEERHNHALVAAEGKVYAVGGAAGVDVTYDDVTLNSAECYDPGSDDWTMIPSMETRRYRLAAVALNNEIYAIGGCMAGRNNLASVERYSPVSEAWDKVASLNHPRAGHSACVIRGKIYVAGGGSDTIELFDPATNVWTIEENFDVLKVARHIVAV